MFINSEVYVNIRAPLVDRTRASGLLSVLELPYRTEFMHISEIRVHPLEWMTLDLGAYDDSIFSIG